MWRWRPWEAPEMWPPTSPCRSARRAPLPIRRRLAIRPGWAISTRWRRLNVCSPKLKSTKPWRAWESGGDCSAWLPRPGTSGPSSPRQANERREGAGEMRLVLAALSRPITVVVALIAIALCAVLAVGRMPIDIFPQVGDPAIYVAQPYGGMDPAQMEGNLTYYYEYHFLYITGIDRVESKSIQGAALMKLVFHEGTNMSQAMSETVGYVNRARAFMPPGTVPPFITRFDAGSVAVGQLVFSSTTHTQGELQDFALNRVRPLFATLPGVSAPPPFGGNQRTIVVTLDPDKLQQYGISPDEAVAAVTRASLVMPSGNIATGTLHRIARTNAALGGNLPELLSMPIRPGSGTTVYLRDIGTIENGTDLITAYAHVNGRRTVYIPVTKRADASTVSVINAVKAAIPDFKKAVPDDVDVRLEFDQSPYVRNSIRGLVVEGLLGAALTGLMVLIFLRDWRSALIVVLKIPFADRKSV